MKIDFTKKELVRIASKIAKIAFYYKTNELYNNLKIKYNKDTAIFQINNDAAFLKIKAGCKSTEEGEIYIDPCSFVSIVNSIDSENIQLESIDTVVYIRGSNSEVRVPVLSKDRFIEGPNLTVLKEVKTINLDSDILKDAFLNCIPFENPKSLISGINFKLNQEGQLRLCCCSELSACLYYIDIDDIKNEEDIEFTLDTKFLKDFKDIFNKEKINIFIYANFLNIKTENTELTLRFLSKKFPTIEKIISNSFKKELPIIKNSFEQAFDLIDIITKNIDATIVYKNGVCSIRHDQGVDVKVDIDSREEEIIHIEREQLRKVFRLVSKNNLVALFNETPKPIVIKEDNKIFLVSVLVK